MEQVTVGAQSVPDILDNIAAFSRRNTCALVYFEVRPAPQSGRACIRYDVHAESGLRLSIQTRDQIEAAFNGRLPEDTSVIVRERPPRSAGCIE